jgi:hypothetical protein
LNLRGIAKFFGTSKQRTGANDSSTPLPAALVDRRSFAKHSPTMLLAHFVGDACPGFARSAAAFNSRAPAEYKHD